MWRVFRLPLLTAGQVTDPMAKTGCIDAVADMGFSLYLCETRRWLENSLALNNPVRAHVIWMGGWGCILICLDTVCVEQDARHEQDGVTAWSSDGLLVRSVHSIVRSLR